MAQMPFSPCVEGQDCHDVSVEVLRWIFGGVIDKLTTGANPDDAQAATSLFGALFQVWGNGVLTVAAFIVAYIAMMGVANTANDGEAMGRNWSSVYTPARVVAYGGVLLPTASGYSFLQLIVMMLALWGIGLANQIQKIGLEQGFLGGTLTSVSPMLGMGEEAVANKNYPLYDLRTVAESYLSVAWCQKTLRAVYSSHSSGVPNIDISASPDQVITAVDKDTSIFLYKDRNPQTNLAGGGAICGTISTYQLKNPPPPDSSTAASVSLTGQATSDTRNTANEQAIMKLRLAAASAKAQAANQMLNRLNSWVGTWPNSAEDEGWDRVNINQFNAIVNESQGGLIQALKNEIDNDPTLKNILNTYIDDLKRDGWAMTGGFYQRLGGARETMSKLYSEKVLAINPPSLSALPEDSYGQTARNSYNTINTLMLMKAISLSNGDVTGSNTPTCSPSSYRFLGEMKKDDIDADSLGGKTSSMIGRCISSIIENGTELLAGTSTDVDAVVRMKNTGEWMADISATLSLVQGALKIGILSGKIVAAPLDTTTNVANALTEFLKDTAISWLTSLMNYMDLFAFYFGVFLPSLPYTIFIIAVVGFFIAVLQSTIAASLWAVMHMTPDRTFIGSQSQGYLLLLSLFVRPALLTFGLFAAFQMINPIVAFSSKAFWAMRSAVVQDESGLAQFFQWKNWVIVYGMMLLPIVYMVFGLSASLADEVLTWVGAGVKPLGQTEALGQMQQRSERHGRDTGAGSGGGGGGGGGGKPPSSRAQLQGDGGSKGGGGGNGKGNEPATGGNTPPPAPVPAVGGGDY